MFIVSTVGPPKTEANSINDQTLESSGTEKHK